MRAKLERAAFEYGIITFATLLLVVGVYFFKFPNNFSFGGVTGIAVVLSAMSKASASSYTFIINMALLVLGFLFLGKTTSSCSLSALVSAFSKSVVYLRKKSLWLVTSQTGASEFSSSLFSRLTYFANGVFL